MNYNVTMICNNCPRKCNIDRAKTTGFCGMTEKIKIAKADLFMWEEPCVSGEKGSGAIFFAGCNLKCCFCQNYKLSSEYFGKEISIQRLAMIFKELEEKGANNINLVSPSHYYKQIIEALKIYKPKIPIIYNSNGYDSLESIKELKNYIDIYLVDLKFYDSNLSLKYCKAKDYFEVASKAIKEMVKMQPRIIFNDENILQKGVIVRHLIMPNCIHDSIHILNWIKDNVGDNVLLSLMCQYTPFYNASKFPEINRLLKPLEYKVVLNKAFELGLTNGFAQEMTSANEKYIPLWDLKGV